MENQATISRSVLCVAPLPNIVRLSHIPAGTFWYRTAWRLPGGSKLLQGPASKLQPSHIHVLYCQDVESCEPPPGHWQLKLLWSRTWRMQPWRFPWKLARNLGIWMPTALAWYIYGKNARTQIVQLQYFRPCVQLQFPTSWPSSNLCRNLAETHQDSPQRCWCGAALGWATPPPGAVTRESPYLSWVILDVDRVLPRPKTYQRKGWRDLNICSKWLHVFANMLTWRISEIFWMFWSCHH